MACGSKPFLIASTNSQEGLYSRGPLKPQVPVFAQLDQPMDGLGCCFLLLCSGQLTWMWNSMLFLDFHQNTLTCICSVHAYARSRFSHVRLCKPVACSPRGSSVHGILQARTLERVAMSFSRRSSQPGTEPCIFCTGGWILYHWATREAGAYFINLFIFQAGANPWANSF